MATLTQNKNGAEVQQTPEELAHEIMTDAVKSEVVEITGTSFQKLEKITKYANRDLIQMRGENYYKKNSDLFRREVLQKLIEDKADAISNYLDKKEQDAKQKLFLKLVASGMSKEEAAKQVF